MCKPLVFFFVFCLIWIHVDLIAVRSKRQQACSSAEAFKCQSGKCINKYLLCDGQPQCDDKSDESSSVCRVISKDCLVPKNAEGTVYNVGECSKTPGLCESPNGKTVEVSCRAGYTISYSVNVSTVLPCPSKDWNHHLSHCEKCGRSSIQQGALTEGKFQTQPGKYPWHVGIYKSFSGTYSIICGGTLITPQIVLTAASCVFNADGTTTNPSNYRIIAAKYNYDYSPLDNVQEINVDKILIRKSFSGDLNSYVHNVALLKMEKSFKINPLVQTVCLYSPVNIPFSFKSLVSIPGWGLSSKERFSTNLREAVFKITDIKSCQKLSHSVTFLRFFSHDKFCVLFNDGVSGFNAIDTGNGIIISSGGINYLHGIVSAKVAVNSAFSIVTNITKHLDWIKKSVHQLSVKNGCSSGHYSCGSGSCITEDLLCNGFDDCEDGSDEGPGICPNKSSPNIPNSSGACILPELTKSNIFRERNCNSDSCNLNAKSSIPAGSLITTSCKTGYAFAEAKNQDKFSACLNGTFYPSLPPCKKLCEPLISESLNIQCLYRGETIPCSKPMLPSTKARHVCTFQYKPQDPSTFKTENVCEVNGRWKYRLPICISICGKKSATEALTTISNGTPTKEGSYPWHVGLYFKNKNNGFDQVCGGSLVSPNIVVTAAHCVYKETVRTVLNKDDYVVAAGKYYRDLAIKDTHMQIMKVKKIEIKNTYYGSSTFYADDIAVLVLVKSFELNNFVLPVCIDRSQVTFGQQPDPCTTGSIAGWGLTENNVSSTELLEVSLPYVDLGSCRRQNSWFTSFLTSDKFCATYLKGAGIQRGDSGGGYTCKGEGGLYYLYGVASLKSKDRNEFGVFTNVLAHMSWLVNQIDSILGDSDRR